MINAIVMKFLKTFFQEEHIEGLIKSGLVSVGTLMYVQGVETQATWEKKEAIILAAVSAIYHFIQVHNKINTPKQ